MSDPVTIPIFTRVLAQAIHKANVEAGEKPKAFDSIHRHSQAGKCAYQLWLDAMGVERSDVIDLPGEMVMEYGTMIHERWQAAMTEAFGPAFQAEVPVMHHYDETTSQALCSGHIDGVLELDDLIYAIELKTKGGFGFGQAIGRQGYVLKDPQGPGGPALLQGALNAYAINADVLVLGVIGLEAVSRQAALKLGFSPEARIMAEWHYGREEYVPWASDELARMESIARDVRDGTPSPRKAVGDHFETVRLDPNADRVDWRCTYCPHLDTCKESPC